MGPGWLVWSWLAAAGLQGGTEVELPAANAAEPCQWPTVVALRGGEDQCSGVLVAPDVILTASHCLATGRPDRIRFGESFQPAARLVEVDACWRLGTDPRPDAGSDLAACRLRERVDVPVTPVLGACETASLQPGQPVVLVGFGIDGTGTDDGDYGTKRYAFSRVDSELRDDGTFRAGDAEVDGCHGDSGGPALVQLPDDTWAVAGILAVGPACGQGPSRYVAPSHHLAWLESTTGRDLTPCRDDTGQWHDGPSCRAAGDPLALGATWSPWCAGVQLLPFDTCEQLPADPFTPMDTPTDASTSGNDEPTPPEPTTGDADPKTRDAVAGGCSIPDRTDVAWWLLGCCVGWRRRPVDWASPAGSTFGAR